MHNKLKKQPINKKTKKEKKAKKPTNLTFFGQVLSFFGGVFRFVSVILDKLFK